MNDNTPSSIRQKIHRVFFIPGFLGFDELAGIKYFVEVDKTLQKFFDDAKMSVKFYFPKTAPLAGLNSRAAILSHAIEKLSWEDQFLAHDPIHLIGHSSGGLDARLLGYCTFLSEYKYRKGLLTDGRLKNICYSGNGYLDSITTLATPHYGTPAAEFDDFFLSKYVLSGGTMIRWLATTGLSLTKYRRVHLLFQRMFNLDLKKYKGLESFFISLLTQEEEGISRFFTFIQKDQTLLKELTPAAMHRFNQTKDDDTLFKHVRCFSTINFAPETDWEQVKALMAESPGFLIYWFFFKQSQGFKKRFPYARDYVFVDELNEMVTKKYSDGVVPTLSQIWGKLLLVQKADHLDIIGHFKRRFKSSIDKVIKSYDLFNSGSNYTEEDFTLLFATIAKNIISTHHT